jgi:superfamily I DNA and RNA helicase
MISAVECRICSEACLLLGMAKDISKKRSMIYTLMARSWTRLASQMDRLAAIKKEEGD